MNDKVWEEVAHDLGYIDRDAMENAVLNQGYFYVDILNNLLQQINKDTNVYEGVIADGVDIVKQLIIKYRDEQLSKMERQTILRRNRY